MAKILLVEDNEMNLDMLSRRLQRAGFEVEVAADGSEALNRVREKEYGLVLLDHMMPGLSGLDVLRLLRATYTAEQLPVIMVTALNDSEKIVEAISAGANDYVTKPLDYPVALARIRSQLSRKTAEAALRESEQRYALAARGSNDGLWDWNVRNNQVYYSSRWKAALGYNDDEIGDSLEEWLSRVPRPPVRGCSSICRQSSSSACGPTPQAARARILPGWCSTPLPRSLARRRSRMAGTAPATSAFPCAMPTLRRSASGPLRAILAAPTSGWMSMTSCGWLRSSPAFW